MKYKMIFYFKNGTSLESGTVEHNKPFRDVLELCGDVFINNTIFGDVAVKDKELIAVRLVEV